MVQFFMALALFMVLHIVPTQAGIKDRLTARFGVRGFRLGYGVLSLVLITWVIVATLQAPRIMLWHTAEWQFTFAIHLMPWSIAFLFGALAAPNPISVAFSSKDFDPANPGIVAISRHPVLWGFGLWGLAHIPANGDIVSLIFFGGMALFSIVGMKRIEAKKKIALGETLYKEFAEATSVIPFLAIVRTQTSFPLSPRLWLQVIIGLIAYAWLLVYGHYWLFGADPLAFY